MSIAPFPWGTVPQRKDSDMDTARRWIADTVIGLIATAILSLFIASLASAGVVSVRLAIGLLCLVFIIAMVGTFLIEHLCTVTWKQRGLIAVVLIIILGLTGLYEWNNYVPPLTANEVATKVIEKLKEQGITPTSLDTPAPNNNSFASCEMKLAIGSQTIARLYARDNINLLRLGKINITFKFQELFYEWKVSVSATENISAVTLSIDHLTDVDSVRTLPENAQISDLHPKWFSGFAEPARKKPDYYGRMIQFNALAAKQSGTVIIRRFLPEPVLSEVGSIRLVDVRSPMCATLVPTYDAPAESRHITYQAEILSKAVYSPTNPPTGLPIKRDPGDVTRNEFQATVETWCENTACDKRTVGQLEVHAGQFPSEFFRKNKQP